ncbi:hypothetical protein B0H19DRAFT_1382988 [Mycena capillaripes]|nr:hypothetical protein B0H19DRAFT_1382988 [Mycena capillaripes]
MHFDQPDARRSANSMRAVTTITSCFITAARRVLTLVLQVLPAPRSSLCVLPSRILDTDFGITVSAGWVFLRFLYRATGPVMDSWTTSLRSSMSLRSPHLCIWDLRVAIDEDLRIVFPTRRVPRPCHLLPPSLISFSALHASHPPARMAPPADATEREIPQHSRRCKDMSTPSCALRPRVWELARTCDTRVEQTMMSSIQSVLAAAGHPPRR